MSSININKIQINNSKLEIYYKGGVPPVKSYNFFMNSQITNGNHLDDLNILMRNETLPCNNLQTAIMDPTTTTGNIFGTYDSISNKYNYKGCSFIEELFFGSNGGVPLKGDVKIYAYYNVYDIGWKDYCTNRGREGANVPLCAKGDGYWTAWGIYDWANSINQEIKIENENRGTTVPYLSGCVFDSTNISDDFLECIKNSNTYSPSLKTGMYEDPLYLNKSYIRIDNDILDEIYVSLYDGGIDSNLYTQYINDVKGMYVNAYIDTLHQGQQLKTYEGYTNEKAIANNLFLVNGIEVHNNKGNCIAPLTSSDNTCGEANANYFGSWKLDKYRDFLNYLSDNCQKDDYTIFNKNLASIDTPRIPKENIGSYQFAFFPTVPTWWPQVLKGPMRY